MASSQIERSRSGWAAVSSTCEPPGLDGMACVSVISPGLGGGGRRFRLVAQLCPGRIGKIWSIATIEAMSSAGLRQGRRGVAASPTRFARLVNFSLRFITRLSVIKKGAIVPDNVIVLNGKTRLDIPAERVLRAALEGGMSSVVVIGFDADDKEYFASSIADGAMVLWLLERSKLKLMRLVETDDEC